MSSSALIFVYVRSMTDSVLVCGSLNATTDYAASGSHEDTSIVVVSVLLEDIEFIYFRVR